MKKNEIFVGDQGIMFGYATDEKKEYMPLSIILTNRLAAQLSIVRKKDKNSPLKLEIKTQITLE